MCSHRQTGRRTHRQIDEHGSIDSTYYPEQEYIYFVVSVAPFSTSTKLKYPFLITLNVQINDFTRYPLGKRALYLCVNNVRRPNKLVVIG